MNADKYSMSFTTGTLLHQESVNIAELYQEKDDWDSVRNEVIENNLLQLKTANSSRRLYSEIQSRLMCLTDDELELLIEGDHHEQAYLLWLAVCRRYRFLYDFSVEVIRERFLMLRYDLGYPEFDVFFNSKMDWHDEMERITTTTRKKLRQFTFKMLHESGLLSSTDSIIPAMLSTRLINLICKQTPEDLAIFPFMNTENSGCAQ